MMFCLTFPVDHPLADNWIEIQASNRESAQQLAFHLFGDQWYQIYLNDASCHFLPQFDSSCFPSGKVGKTVIAKEKE